jgi:hypothetical protein
MQQPHPQKSEWDQEFDLLKAMQENRMHLTAAKQCVDRCTKHTELYTNIVLPHEEACIKECLAKRAQVAFICSANVLKFDELESRNAPKKGWFG